MHRCDDCEKKRTACLKGRYIYEDVNSIPKVTSLSKYYKIHKVAHINNIYY